MKATGKKLDSMTRKIYWCRLDLDGNIMQQDLCSKWKEAMPADWSLVRHVYDGWYEPLHGTIIDSFSAISAEHALTIAEEYRKNLLRKWEEAKRSARLQEEEAKRSARVQAREQIQAKSRAVTEVIQCLMAAHSLDIQDLTDDAADDLAVDALARWNRYLDASKDRGMSEVDLAGEFMSRLDKQEVWGKILRGNPN